MSGNRSNGRMRRWVRDEEGGVALEATVITPLLFWAYLAGFVYFEAFRTQSLNDTATFAIADVLSRQTEMVDAEYVEALWKSHKALTFSREDSGLRISQVQWDEDAGQHELIWSISEGPAALAQLQQSDLTSTSEIVAHIPTMADNERMIVVEGFLPFDPPMEAGLDEMIFHVITPIESRYGPKLCLDRNSTGDINQAEC